MKTLELDFTINGNPATVMIEFEDGNTKVSAIRLKFGNFFAAGVSQVKDCLGDSYDSLIAHAIAVMEQS